MQKLLLKPGFTMLLAEINFLCGLKPNATDTELSGTEKRQISNIYYKYFGSLPVSEELMENEAKSKWPGGERKKVHECQRAVLDTLHKLNSALPKTGQIQEPVEPMDLVFVMRFLQEARANEILILTMCTDVQEIKEHHEPALFGVVINGKKFLLETGSYSMSRIAAIYNEKYVPVEAPLTFKFRGPEQPDFIDAAPNTVAEITEGGWAFSVSNASSL